MGHRRGRRRIHRRLPSRRSAGDPHFAIQRILETAIQHAALYREGWGQWKTKIPSIIRQITKVPIVGTRPSPSTSKTKGTLIRSLLTAKLSVDFGFDARLGIIDKFCVASREFDVAFGMLPNEVIEFVGWRQPGQTREGGVSKGLRFQIPRKGFTRRARANAGTRRAEECFHALAPSRLAGVLAGF